MSENGKPIDVKVVELGEKGGTLYFEKGTGRLVRIERKVYGSKFGKAQVCADMDGFVHNKISGDSLPTIFKVSGVPKKLIQAPLSDERYDGVLQLQIDPNEGLHLHSKPEWDV